MVKEINGHTLSNNMDLFIYYKQIAGADLLSDLTKRANTLKGATQEEILDRLEGFDIIEFSKNLYYAGRCAAEDRLIPIAEIKEELTVDILLDGKVLEDLMSLVIRPEKKRP